MQKLMDKHTSIYERQSINLYHCLEEKRKLEAIVKSHQEMTANIHSVDYQKMKELFVGNGLQDQIRQAVQSQLASFFPSSANGVEPKRHSSPVD